MPWIRSASMFRSSSSPRLGSDLERLRWFLGVDDKDDYDDDDDDDDYDEDDTDDDEDDDDDNDGLW